MNELVRTGAAVAHLTCDLTIPGKADSAVRGCVDRFGRIDGLFNVAGGSARAQGDGAIVQCTDEGWERALDLNATTQFRMCRAALLQVLTQARDASGMRGGILNMSSILALHPSPQHFDAIGYAASKGAVLAMSRTIAAAYAGEGIRCNVVAPALVETAMSWRAAEDDRIRSFAEQKQPLAAGIMQPGNVAAACAFLLSGSAARITGQTLGIDAGWSVS